MWEFVDQAGLSLRSKFLCPLSTEIKAKALVTKANSHCLAGLGSQHPGQAAHKFPVTPAPEI